MIGRIAGLPVCLHGEHGWDIYDPDGYVEAPPHDVFDTLRREHPVYRQEMPDGTWYWAVLRHADVVTVSRHPLLYSASAGGVECWPTRRMVRATPPSCRVMPARRRTVMPSPRIT